MPHSTGLPSGVIEAEINYWLEPPKGQPYPVIQASTAGSKRMKWDTHKVQVTDLRGREDEFVIEKNGFQVVPFDTKEKAYDDDDRIKQTVYPEAVELLKKTTGATYAHILGHIVRRQPSSAIPDLIKDLPDDAEIKGQFPAGSAHVDQSYDGAKWILEGKIKDDTLNHKPNTRWGIINIWHPIKPINREALAVCDAQSVPDSDLRPVKLQARNSQDGVVKVVDTELWFPVYSPQHKWYWPKRLTPQEALLLKCFDSKTDGRARRAPHSPIVTPDDQGPPRESIEIRCLVFWEDQDEK